MVRSTRHQQSDSRLILTQIGSHRVAFPAVLVGEIVSFERSLLLPLPMYVRQCLGIVHHRGTLMPLYSLQADPAVRESVPGTLTAIRLGVEAGERAGIGIAIDRLLGQVLLRQEDERALALATALGSASPAVERVEASSPIGDRPNTGGGTVPSVPLNPTLTASAGPAYVASESSPETDRDQSSLSLHIFSLDDLSDPLWSPWRTIVSPPA